jgi:hypothetical protein
MLTSSQTKVDVGYTDVELGERTCPGEGGVEGGVEGGTPMESVRAPNAVKLEDIKWTQINFRVKEKQILSNCWGHVPNGKLMAIMVCTALSLSCLMSVSPLYLA